MEDTKMSNKKQKKGISPLIATVIIIGFTIVLAAIVIQFGTGFVKRTTEGAEKTGAIKQLCTISLASLDMRVNKDATTGDLTVVIDNKNDVKIEGFVMRLYESPTKIKTIQKTKDNPPKELAEYKIEKYSIETLTIAAPDSTFTAKEVGILARVRAKETDPDKDIATCDNELKTGVVGA